MAVLTRTGFVLAALTGLAACYSPELTDCTVSCSGNDDCAGDQLCSAGYCAASGVDCREDPDPLPTPPPATSVTLHVEVDGEGKVVVANVGTCTNGMPDDDEEDDAGARIQACQWTVARGTEVRLHAMMLRDKPFDKWSESCEGQGAVCTVAATDTVLAKAKFK